MPKDVEDVVIIVEEKYNKAYGDRVAAAARRQSSSPDDSHDKNNREGKGKRGKCKEE